MGEVLRFPTGQSDLLHQLDVSVACMHRLRYASELPSKQIRVEALGAWLDMASLREEMDGALSDQSRIPGRSAVIEHIWDRLDRLIDQVAICAYRSYSDMHGEHSYGARSQLRGACQSTLAELDNLRMSLEPMT